MISIQTRSRLPVFRICISEFIFSYRVSKFFIVTRSKKQNKNLPGFKTNTFSPFAAEEQSLNDFFQEVSA